MPTPDAKVLKQLASLIAAPKSKSPKTSSKPRPPLVTPPVVLPPAAQQADPAEPETATSSYLTSEKRKCAANKRDGAPCRANPLPSGEHCLFHAPAYAERVQEARIEGGRRSPYQLPDKIDDDIWNVDFCLATRGGLQGSMEAVMRLLILGRIPTRHASILMRFFDAAIRNFHGVDKLRDGDYGDTLQGFLLTSGLIERDLDDQALKERVQQLADAGAKRQEILKANEAFGFGATPKQFTPSRQAMEGWDMPYGPPPPRERFDPIAAWGLPPGTGEGGRLSIQDLFPNGLPGTSPSEPRPSEPRT